MFLVVFLSREVTFNGLSPSFNTDVSFNVIYLRCVICCKLLGAFSHSYCSSKYKTQRTHSK